MQRRSLILGAAGAIVFNAWGSANAQLVSKYAEQLKNGEFNWFPERSAAGPILVIVSIPDQLVHVYRNGIRIAASTCSTGKPGHSTPTGVFKILQKDKHHKSSTYSNAPMPNMNRLTWSGIALHAGKLPGYPASHGCVRLPMQFSELLFNITKLGMTVVIADNKHYPAEVVHPGLVLGEFAQHEFGGVDRAIRKAQYTEGRSSQPKHTSIVVSGKDRTMTVFENDKVVASGSVTISGEKPLPESVHNLAAIDSSRSELKWSSAGYGKSDREDLTRELRRIKAAPKLQEEVRKRTHHGMTLVTTHESSTEASRTDGGFTIIDGIY